MKCLIPNCKQNLFFPFYVRDLSNINGIEEHLTLAKSADSNMTYLTLLLMRHTEPLKVTTEEPAYGFSSFLADFGGYLGLLLGASILSIYDQVKHHLTMVFGKTKNVSLQH